MKKDIHQQSILDSTGLLPRKSWKIGLLHFILLLVIVFITELSSARADMVFDFQMKLAQKGNAEAQFKVGEMYEAGRGVEENMVEALLWIKRAAAQGNKAANYKLLYNDLQLNGINKDNKVQLDELKDAANAGDGYALYYFGLMHSQGVGQKKNSDMALDWLGKASLQGITAAETEIMRIKEVQQNSQSGTGTKQGQAELNQDEARKQQQAQDDKEKRAQQAVASRKIAEEKKRAQQREAERIAAENEFKELRLAAQKQAEDEKKRLAITQQRNENENEKKVKFESDPCAGKSARFLSSCK